MDSLLTPGFGFDPGFASSGKELCSIFLIGLLMRDKVKASPAQAFAAVLELHDSLAAKWG